MIEGKRKLFIGIGGGSDCVQAAILAQLSDGENCFASIRRNKLGSQIGNEKIGGDRTVIDHGGEVSYPNSGVYRIEKDTKGSGRFLENLAANDLPSYLIIDNEDGRLRQQIQLVMFDFKNVDTVIGVDTGGDALYKVEQAEDIQGKTTPDQDICSLLALARVKNVDLYSVIVAKGVDTPPYADEVLKKANADYIELEEDQINKVLNLYKKYELDGSNENLYGKTPFAWQAALRGEIGKVKIPLPESVINHPTNPWNPIVNIEKDTRGIYIMKVEEHVKAISS